MRAQELHVAARSALGPMAGLQVQDDLVHSSADSVTAVDRPPLRADMPENRSGSHPACATDERMACPTCWADMGRPEETVT